MTTARTLACSSPSSSTIFGAAPESPQRETTPAVRRRRYTTAKLAAHQLVGQLRGHDRIFACSGILYNHESERRPVNCSSPRSRVRRPRYKLGLTDSVTLGDLGALRDWSFAGDVMLGAWLMLQQEHADDYLLASGIPHAVQEFREIAFACVGLRAQDHIGRWLSTTTEAIPPIGDPPGVRASRVAASISFEQLIQRMVDADLRALR